MSYQINKTKYLNPSELEHLKRIVCKDNTRNGLMIRLALATGARAQELLNVKHSDLDTSNRTVFIRGLKNSNDREIPIDEQLFNELMQLPKTHETVFGISYPRLVVIWNFYKPTDKKFHSLRHTFAIELFKRTRDLHLVKTALGHRNIMNTMVYADYIYQTEELRRLLA